ncbi:MAG: hypothetical protein LBK46_09705 [Oscillospiraceae bacterium]|nr:hypothetical protein [Oscillospiraceae bacterium]
MLQIGKIFDSKAARTALALPVALMIVLAFLFMFNLQEYHQVIYAEKLIEKRLNLDMIANEVDRLIADGRSWQDHYEFFLETARINMEMLDATYMTYAAVLDADFVNVTYRTLSESIAFEPADYPEFVEAARNNESGSISLWFESADVAGREMNVYYRWIPSDNTLPDRFLIVDAISAYSVQTRKSMLISYLIAALILVVTVLNCSFVVMLEQMREYQSRQEIEARRTGDDNDTQGKRD